MEIILALEILAVFFGLLFLILMIFERIECWIFGIIGSLLSIYLFVHLKLYSEAILYLYYVFIGFYGYLSWSKKKNGIALKVSNISVKSFLYGLSISTLLSFILGYFFQKFTDATQTYYDAFTTIFSFYASYLEAKKVLFGWLLWIVVNGATIILYQSKSLDFYAGLTIFYFLMSFVGYFKWKKKMATYHDIA